MGLVMGAGYDNNNGSTIPPLPSNANMGTPILATPMTMNNGGGASSSSTAYQPSTSYQPQTYPQLPLPPPSSQHGMNNHHMQNHLGSSMYVNALPTTAALPSHPIHSLSTPYYQPTQSNLPIPPFPHTVTAGAYDHPLHPSNHNHHNSNLYTTGSNGFVHAATASLVGATNNNNTPSLPPNTPSRTL